MHEQEGREEIDKEGTMNEQINKGLIERRKEGMNSGIKE